MPDSEAPPLEVTIGHLDDIVGRFRSSANPLGYFAAMYRQTTSAVGRDIAAGEFEDGDRMGRMIANFAGRYFDAMDPVLSGTGSLDGLTRSWRVAVEAAQAGDRLILQHLVLGINAHVNLDLAIAAAETAGPEISSFEADFARINDILARLTDAVQGAVGRFSPLLDIVWRISDEPDDVLLGFSFRVAREEAWRRAVMLALIPPWARPPVIDSSDRAVALLGRLVGRPQGLGAAAVALVRHTESTDVAAVIDALADL